MKEAVEELIKSYEVKISYLKQLMINRQLIGKLYVVEKQKYTTQIEGYNQMIDDLKLLKNDNKEN